MCVLWECGCICMISICVADNQLWLLWLNEGYECLWMTIWPISVWLSSVLPHISVWLLTTNSNQCECLAISVYVWQSEYVSEYVLHTKLFVSLYYSNYSLNSSPNTNDLYIHYMDKSTGTPSLEEKKALPNCANKDVNIINVLKICISISVASVFEVYEMTVPYVQVIGVWWWVCGSFKVTPEVFSCFLQTSQVLPHWLNHHFSLILVLYTETLSC